MLQNNLAEAGALHEKKIAGRVISFRKAYDKLFTGANVETCEKEDIPHPSSRTDLCRPKRN